MSAPTGGIEVAPTDTRCGFCPTTIPAGEPSVLIGGRPAPTVRACLPCAPIAELGLDVACAHPAAGPCLHRGRGDERCGACRQGVGDHYTHIPEDGHDIIVCVGCAALGRDLVPSC